jgi:hypothetical protein
MRANLLFASLLLIGLSGAADATVFRFDTDPFAGSTALTTPGRQVVAGEAFISFSPLTDVFSLETTVFGVGNKLHFFNGVVADIPTSGVNTIVLRTFDNDANPATPFAAGTAANLIASQITTPGPGFFIYFNQGLDLPRLVYSTDLNDNTADLKILFRMTNLAGNSGALTTFTADNFLITNAPEPSTLALAGSALLIGGLFWARRRRLRRPAWRSR